MCEFAGKMLLKMETVWTFIKIDSIPDVEWFSETAIGCTASFFVKISLSATGMNNVLKYVIGLDLLNCHAKFHGDTSSQSRVNDVRSCYFW